MANINDALNWMLTKRSQGLRYSQPMRLSNNYADCSSAVLRALQSAGFNVPWIGNTESMFSWRGSLFLPITRAEIRAGDVFVSGYPGGSGGNAGHAGFAYTTTQAIHCTGRADGITITSNADSAVGAFGGAPVYWFRVAGATAPPTPEEPDEDTILISDVNDGKEYLRHEELIKLFGVNVETKSFSDVTGPADLKQKAMDELNNQPIELYSLSIDFAQLYKLDPRFKEIKLRDIVKISNTDLNVDVRMRLDSLAFALDEDEIGQAEFGKSWQDMTRKTERRN